MIKPLLADRMLGKLARILRMVGHDVEFAREGEPAAIALRARAEGRVLLTRDRKLARRLDRGSVLFVGNQYPFHQARRVIRELGLTSERQFSRCVEDNGLLVELPRAEAASSVPAGVLEVTSRFFRCRRCERIYWEGTHVRAMRGMIDALQDAPTIPEEDCGESEESGSIRVLQPVLDLHQAMEVLLVQYRLALMRGAVAEAAPLFRRFALCMRRHVQDETTLVLPVYVQTAPMGGFERGAHPDLFDTEHRKILDHLDRLQVATESLADAGGSSMELEVRCLQLLDRQKIFVDLLEHHDLRERQFLYPALELALTEEEKMDLLDRMVGSAGELVSKDLSVIP